MEFLIDPAFHTWFGILMTVVAFYLFSSDRWPLEVGSVVLLATLMLVGQIFPLMNEDGENLISATSLLAGFSNPSLIAVLALLVIGAALIQTAALTPVTRILLLMKPSLAIIGLVAIFLFVLVVSAFMNNTPLVIIAIPVLQALSARLHINDSRIMIPLSFIAILGGMTTLVGSSTNLLVSTALVDLGYPEFSFFQFTLPGAMLAGVGVVYVAFVLPFILPKRASLAEGLHNSEETFVAELDISNDSSLIGTDVDAEGTIQKLPSVTVRMVQRGGGLILPPFDDYTVQASDIMIVATTRKGMMDVLSSHPGFLLSTEGRRTQDVEAEETELQEDLRKSAESREDMNEARVLCEVMIPPGSEYIDQSVGQLDLAGKMDCIVLGIQRRASVVRRRVHQMRLEAGDVMLVAGLQSAIYALRDNPEMIVLAGSRKDIPVKEKSAAALLIFITTILLASFGIFSITVAAVTGAVAMVLARCLTIPQVMRAFDQKIYFLVGSALALGAFLQVSGGAMMIANSLLSLPAMNDPLVAASTLFILIAIATNLLTNNACAVLFTPIAINLALEVGVDPMMFAMTVVFAANCSFASPIGYQTNLLVMGPGHYKFKDFIVAGVPLVLIMWGAYTIMVKYYFGM
tara:strand:+ start:4512 stop:6404 length:1893 start_codon:yes stop_codon:yes gene_type:complete